MQRKTLLLGCCVGFVSAGFAQLSETDTARWAWNANLSGRLNTGNVERLLITPEINITHIAAGKSYGFAFGERYTYGTFGAFKSESDLLSRNFFYLHPSTRLYPFAMLWLQTHERQRLRFRYQAGAGLTWVAVRKQMDVLKLSLTATYEQNWYREGNLTFIKNPLAKNYSTVRGTFRLVGNHWLTGAIINLYYDGYFQQALNNMSNWRVFAEGGANIRLIKGFGMRVFATYEYQTVHVATQKPADLILNFGVTYRCTKN